ncbi:MAG: L7Ae/L30e/S12e/Gadd45 family ribosomal protein [Bacillota bacterium]
MSDTRILGLLGLAARAGGVIDGSERVLAALRKSHKPIVFLASDAGGNTAKKIHDKCAFYQIELNERFTKEALSKAVGKKNRTVLAVTDQRFVKPLCKL